MANNGETMETVTDFIFSGSKITEMVTAAMKLKRMDRYTDQSNRRENIKIDPEKYAPLVFDKDERKKIQGRKDSFFKQTVL